MPKNSLLFVKLDPPVNGVKEFNTWYNTVHIPPRLALSGWLTARRFTLIKGIPRDTAISPEAEYLAMYDLKDVSFLNSKAYNDLRAVEGKRGPDSFETNIFKMNRFARGAYEQIYPEKGDLPTPRKFAFVVGHDVPENRHEEFNAWYNTEHIPTLLSIPGFKSVRRFRLNEKEAPPSVDKGGTISSYLTIWDLDDEKTLASDSFSKMSGSPWTNWVRSWYTRKICALYKCIYPE
jgi:hypothetical protein